MAKHSTSASQPGFASWTAFFNHREKLNQNNKEKNNKLVLAAAPASYAGDTTALYNHVETLQEGTALLLPASNKTIRMIHHCFSDLTREKIIGVQGLQKYAPFKEVASDHAVMAFRPPLTRESAKIKIPTFEDFASIKTAGEFNKLEGTGEIEIEQLRETAASLWVAPHHMTRFYGKDTKSGDVAAKILANLPPKETDDELEGETLMIYNQLVFLWAVDQGFSTALSAKDPSINDSTQAVVESVNNLLHTPATQHKLQNDNDDEDTDPDDDSGRDEARDEEPGKTIGKHKHKTSSAKKKGTTRNPVDHGGSDPSDSSDEGGASNGGRSRSPTPPPRHRRHREDYSGYGRRRSTDRSRSRSHSSRRGGHRTNRDRSRSRSPNRHRRSRSPNSPRHNYQDADLVNALIQGVTALTKGQLETSERERKKASVLSRLSRRQTFLFDALSAEGWRDYRPRRSKEADLLIEDRDVERNWNLLVDMTEEWPGGISKPAFVQFFTKGYVSQERPGGFTAFMFSPPTRYKQGKKDRKRNLRNVLGKQSEVDEDDLEYYAKNAFHIPKSIYEGETQIKMSILLLDLLTNPKSISSDGYRFGLEFLDKRRSMFHDEQAKDEMFIARYVNLLDTTFQRFAADLGKFHAHSDPIGQARGELRGRMERDIRRVMRDIDLDIIPNLPMPPRLTEQEQSTNPTLGSTKRKKPKDTAQTNASTNSDATTTPDWWKTNPSPEPSWVLPNGKSFRDYFDPGSQAGRLNLALFPKTSHHSSKITLKRSICARYQCEKTCKPACNQAHVVPSKMPPDIRAETAAAFAKAYS